MKHKIELTEIQAALLDRTSKISTQTMSDVQRLHTEASRLAKQAAAIQADAQAQEDATLRMIAAEHGFDTLPKDAKITKTPEGVTVVEWVHEEEPAHA